jgi:hypothetical protein
MALYEEKQSTNSTCARPSTKLRLLAREGKFLLVQSPSTRGTL